MQSRHDQLGLRDQRERDLIALYWWIRCHSKTGPTSNKGRDEGVNALRCHVARSRNQIRMGRISMIKGVPSWKCIFFDGGSIRSVCRFRDSISDRHRRSWEGGFVCNGSTCLRSTYSIKMSNLFVPSEYELIGTLFLYLVPVRFVILAIRCNLCPCKLHIRIQYRSVPVYRYNSCTYNARLNWAKSGEWKPREAIQPESLLE